MWARAFEFLAVFLALDSCVWAEYRSDGGFVPSEGYLRDRTEDQVAQPSRIDRGEKDQEGKADRTQRFGISAYGNSGSQSPYGGTGPGYYGGSVKIDLGGVLLGTILGFGAVLVLPKLVQAFSYSYGPYGRSVDSGLEGVSEALSRVDETLARYNVDSAACAQRLACSYSRRAAQGLKDGNATEADALVAALASNKLVHRMLEGTPILEALTAGDTDTDCQHKYPKCRLDKKTVVKLITQMLP